MKRASRASAEVEYGGRKIRYYENGEYWLVSSRGCRKSCRGLREAKRFVDKINKLLDPGTLEVKVTGAAGWVKGTFRGLSGWEQGWVRLENGRRVKRRLDDIVLDTEENLEREAREVELNKELEKAYNESEAVEKALDNIREELRQNALETVKDVIDKAIKVGEELVRE